MFVEGDIVRVRFSECKGFGATKVGAIGTVAEVDEPIYKVVFADGSWDYLERELELTEVQDANENRQLHLEH